MAHINLLPWREERRQERQQQFFTALVIAFVIAAAILFAAVLYEDSLLDEQKSRNTFLQTEISKLDVKIAEIKEIDQEREQLLTRMTVIQELQDSRPNVVRVFDSLVRSVPDGIHLEKVQRRGETLTLDGIAQSNARVSVFMRNIDESAEFENPDLTVIKRTSTNDDAIRKFTLVTKETQTPDEIGEGDK